MKKIFAIAFLHLYLFSIIGLSMNVHHCAGKTSYTIFEIDFNKLCNCQHSLEEHSSDCCHDDQVAVKAIDSDKISNKTIAFNKIYTPYLVALFSDNIHINFNFSTNTNTVFKHEYPPRYSPPIYILNKVFLI